MPRRISKETPNPKPQTLNPRDQATDAKEELEGREGQNTMGLHKAMHEKAKSEVLLERERALVSQIKAKVGIIENSPPPEPWEVLFAVSKRRGLPDRFFCRMY